MAAVPQIENYKLDLAVLLDTFIKEPDRGGSSYKRPRDDEFTDEFGNSINFGHTEPACTGIPLLKLLKSGEKGWANIQDVDKGHLSYWLGVHGDYFMVYQSKVDLYGWIGKFDSYVILRSLDPLIQFLEEKMANSSGF
eukprot:gene16164-18451_t